MELDRISIGIVSCGRPQQLNKLLCSIDNIEWDLPLEICYIENRRNNDSDECISMFKKYKEESKYQCKCCVVDHNLGFWSAWNILENIMTSNYRIMMQDDTHFLNLPQKENISSIIEYIKKYNWLYMRLNVTGKIVEGQETLYYSEQPHIEHRDLRIKVGDYVCYPRHYRSLLDQGIIPEPQYNSRLWGKDFENKISNTPLYKLGIYKKTIAFHQDSGNSIIQSLAHAKLSKDISRTEKEKLWINANLDDYNIPRKK